MSDEKEQAAPKLKAVPMELNPDLLIGVSAKGAVALYGFRRFPIVLYKSEMDSILEVADEIKQFMLDHTDILSTDKPGAGKALDKTETYRINQTDIAVLAKEVERLTAAADVPGAIKYATIKATAEQNKLEVSPEAMVEIMTLKARK
jgi:hypothetical protein